MLVTLFQTWNKHSLSHPGFGEAAVKVRGLLEQSRAKHSPVSLQRGKQFHGYRAKS